MKKLLTALAALALVSAAQAVLVPIDDFGGSQGPLTDSTASAAATAPPDAVCDTIVGVRTLCTSLIANPLNRSNVTDVSGGYLNIDNGNGSDTQATLRWTLAQNFVASTATGFFNFLVVQSDGNPTDLTFLFNGNVIHTDAILANSVNAPVRFAANIATLAAGGVLELRINGGAGWDLTLDSFGLDVTNAAVPAPALPLLLGAGLVAIGLRRKQK